MTSPAVFAQPSDSVFAALEQMVTRGISGMPVVDEDGQVIGVVSGYDLLALESTPGTLDTSIGFFPPVNRCQDYYDGNREAMWHDFRQIRRKMNEAKGSTVGEVMHDAETIPQNMPLTDAANIIVRKRLHRLAVVDAASSKLVGVLSRHDVMRATLENFRYLQQQLQASPKVDEVLSKE